MGTRLKLIACLTLIVCAILQAEPIKANGSTSVTGVMPPLPTPTVISISPANGDVAGGTIVTIAGGGFVNGATVTIGGIAATGVTWVSATSITATAPANTVGAKDVVVTNPYGQSGTLTGGFNYRGGSGGSGDDGTVFTTTTTTVPTTSTTPVTTTSLTTTPTVLPTTTTAIITTSTLTTTTAIIAPTTTATTIPPTPIILSQKVTTGNNMVTQTNVLLDSKGVSEAAGQISTIDGSVFFGVAAGTQMLDAQGQPLLEVTASIPSSYPPSVPPDVIVLPYDFGPSGATFSPALTMTLKYDTLPANIIGNTLFIAWWNGSKWLEIPSTIDPVNKTVTAQVSHFTDYVVMGKKLTTNSPPWSLIISIIILVIFIIFIIFFLAWRRRKKQEEERRIERI
jgi:hypothetical protein